MRGDHEPPSDEVIGRQCRVRGGEEEERRGRGGGEEEGVPAIGRRLGAFDLTTPPPHSRPPPPPSPSPPPPSLSSLLSPPERHRRLIAGRSVCTPTCHSPSLPTPPALLLLAVPFCLHHGPRVERRRCDGSCVPMEVDVLQRSNSVAPCSPSLSPHHSLPQLLPLFRLSSAPPPASSLSLSLPPPPLPSVAEEEGADSSTSHAHFARIPVLGRSAERSRLLRLHPRYHWSPLTRLHPSFILHFLSSPLLPPKRSPWQFSVRSACGGRRWGWREGGGG